MRTNTFCAGKRLQMSRSMRCSSLVCEASSLQGTRSLRAQLNPPRGALPRGVRLLVNASAQLDAAGLEPSDVHEIRSVVASTLQYSAGKMQRPKPTGNPVTDFVAKVKLAWHIFFPEQQKVATPKEEVKRRLRMVLVADRCGMSPASLSEMKSSIVKALQEFVDIETEDAIEVSITTEPVLGTVYSVNIPIRRVKPDSRFNLPEGQVSDGISIEWDPTDWNSSPEGRFPMGC